MGITRAKIPAMSRFRVGFASTLVTDVTSRLLSALTTVVLIRQLPVSDYAFVVLFFAVGQFVGTSATGGLRLRYLRGEAERISRGTPLRLDFLSAVLGGLLLIGCVGLGALLLGTVFDIGSPNKRVEFIGLCVGFSGGQAVLELATAHYQAHLAFLRGGLVSIGRTSSLLIAVCIATMIFSASGQVTALVLVALTGATALLIALTIARGIPRRKRSVRARDLGLDAEAGWLTVYSLVAAGFATVDVFIVAAILDGYDVAAFGAAQRYYAVALGAAPALEAVLRVRTSQHDIVDSPDAQVRALRNWLMRATLPAALLTGGLALLSPVIIPFIDHGRYPVSIPVFQILLIGALAYYLAMPGLNILMAQRRYRLLAFAFGLAFTVNAAGDLIFGKAIGLVGIAMVATASLVALSVAEVLLAFRGARAKDIISSAAESLVAHKSTRSPWVARKTEMSE
jgi:O-antigen/teichoic acid export membrane protein